MAPFKASARSLDQGVGTVLNALEEHDLVDDTLVIMTTDHGLAFPDAKCTMFDRGIGVLLLMRGPGGFDRRSGAPTRSSAISTLFPTICDVAGSTVPTGSREHPCSRSSAARCPRSTTRSSPSSPTTPLTSPSVRCAPAGTSTCAASIDRERAESCANVDDGLTKDVVLDAGWADIDTPDEALYDLWLDPAEGTNRIADPALADIADELRRRLHDWMVRTDDPLLDGPCRPAPGRCSTQPTSAPPRNPRCPLPTPVG